MAQENISSKERASLARQEKAKALEGLFNNCFKPATLLVEGQTLIQPEARQSENRPSENRQSEFQLSENRPSENRQSESRPSENRQSENRPPENRPPENRQSESRPPENRQSEIRQSENRPPENRQSESRPPESRPSENRQSENRPSKNRQSESRPSENRPSENRPSENRQSETRQPENRQFIKSPVYGKLIPLIKEIGLAPVGLLAVLIEKFPSGEGRINIQHFTNECGMSKSALKAQIHTLEQRGLIELGATQTTGENTGRNLKIQFLLNKD